MTLETGKNKDIDSSSTDISFLINAPSSPQTKPSEDQETVYKEEKKLKRKKNLSEESRKKTPKKKKNEATNSPPIKNNDKLNIIAKAGAYYKYYVILESLKNSDNLVTMSKSELSKIFGTSLSTTKRAINELQKRHLIYLNESHSSKNQISCTYEILN